VPPGSFTKRPAAKPPLHGGFSRSLLVGAALAAGLPETNLTAYFAAAPPSASFKAPLQLLVHARQQAGGRCLDGVVTAGCRGGCLRSRARRSVFGHRHPSPELRVRQRDDGLHSRVVPVVAAAGFFADERGAFQVVGHGTEVRGRRERPAVDEHEHLPKERGTLAGCCCAATPACPFSVTRKPPAGSGFIPSRNFATCSIGRRSSPTAL